ncbi:hypothetical protein BGZ46_003734 [Entomortierella lignicola]|nr:hypothetical protein BGZ46_003734 [Entomortierella lignicola]
MTPLQPIISEVPAQQLLLLKSSRGSVSSSKKLSSRSSSSSSFAIILTTVAIALSAFSLDTVAAGPSSSSTPLSPYPIGGFAICQTKSALYIQGGVAYDPTATFLLTTNQHFRLDLSQGFDSSTTTNPPTWVNLTSNLSPFQRFHSGDCTPDGNNFLTLGNADSTDSNNFMVAYDINKGTWSNVNQAISGASAPASKTSGKAKGGSSSTTGSTGRTMVGFALGSGNGVNSSATSLGLAVGGGWLPSATKTPSVLASALTSLVTELDLMATGVDGGLDSFSWSVAPNTGNGGNNVNSNLGAIAGAKVVMLPSTGKAVVLGGVTNGVLGGIGFANVRIVDMTTGSVTLQSTQTGSLFGSLAAPAPRYGHCVALSADGSTIYMFGGSLALNDQITNDFFALNINTWTWSQPSIKSSSVTPPPVRDHQCFVVGNQFISLFGFNTNQVPASGSTSAGSSIPSAPPIYVLSTSQMVWSTQFTPLPGTPSPPPPPTISSSGKVNGAAVAFGVIFGGAFLAVIAYVVYTHKRKQRRKAELLQLIELENQKREEARLEKERKERLDKDVPLPPTTPVMAHTYNSNYIDEQGRYGGSNNPVSGPIASVGGYYMPPSDPFQDPNQYYYQQQLQQHSYPESRSEAVPYYDTNNRNDNAGGRNPFELHSNYNSNNIASTAYVPEEMGYVSPGASAGQMGGKSAGDKTSFVEANSSFHSR